MPHVRRPELITVEASPTEVQEIAQRVLGFTAEADGALTGPLPNWADTGARQRLETRAVDGHATELALEIENATRVPYFEWFLAPFLRRGERRTLRYTAARLEAALEGRPAPPEPRRRSPLLPPVPFAPQAIALLGTVAAIAALANFGGALFGQTADSVTKTFGASNRGLGLALGGLPWRRAHLARRGCARRPAGAAATPADLLRGRLRHERRSRRLRRASSSSPARRP